MRPNQLLGQLAALPRTGWLLKGIAQPETVGDHSFLTALVALILSLYQDPTNHLAAEKECYEAFIHDIEELWVGDVTPLSQKPREFEALLSDPRQCANLADAERKVLEGLRPANPHSVITGVADRFERYIQAHEYARIGVRSLEDLMHPDFGLEEAQGAPRDRMTKLVRFMGDYVASLSDARQVLLSSKAAMSEWYAGRECVERLLVFQRRYGNPRHELIDKALTRQLIQVSSRMSIVDIGCGTADLGLYIAQKASSAILTRIDINRDLLDSLREGQLGGIRIRNCQADFSRRWPISTESQDMVVMGEVLEHSFHPRWLLREARRVLKPDGVVLITVPNSWHWLKIGRFLFRQTLEKEVFSEHIRYFSARTLLGLLRKEMFSIKMMEGFDLKWPFRDSFRGRMRRAYSRLPLCGRNYFVVAGRDGSPALRHHEEGIHEDSRLIVEFLTRALRGKRLRFSPAGGESIFQMAFRVGGLGALLAKQLNLVPERVAICAVIRGCIEASIGEYAPRVRAQLSGDGLRSILQPLLSELPPSLRDECEDLYEEVSRSLEWSLIVDLFRFEANGRNPANIPEAFPQPQVQLIEATY